ncbi:hypothetical protein BAE44_0024938 [Dichanthelium oligosanthes]|uniref:F-box domain-containing protein n=1 Tax=Dichanthelium oligosanthes TaxID=888268 RepID=A0A1E5UMD5_9POAL|nr:hypothetical protein BAE44_0024938 [Dichanthelium oligosanthes]
MAEEESRRVLDEVLIGEIVFHLPPNRPACLFRASAVCKAWRTFLTDPDILRIYRELHKAPPVLGFLRNVGRADEPPDPLGLVVCDPITDNHQLLPDQPYQYQPGQPEPPYSHFTGAVLCAVDGCNHLDCREGPFRVVFTATAYQNVDVVFTWASLYSSETGTWTEPTIVYPGPVMDPLDGDVMGPSLLAGDSLYFTLDLQNNRTVLRYDLGGGALSVMDPPPLLVRRDTFLVTGEDGGLGVAAVESYSLRLWSWKAADGWALHRVIDLEMMIPFTVGISTIVFKVIGYAEMSGIIFVSANGITSSVRLRSGRVSNFNRILNVNTIFPFETFYTLGMQGHKELKFPGQGLLHQARNVQR